MLDDSTLPSLSLRKPAPTGSSGTTKGTDASATTLNEQPRNPRTPDRHLTHKGDHTQLGLQEAWFTPHAHPEQHKHNPKQNGPRRDWHPKARA
jgi:hypothetical protein